YNDREILANTEKGKPDVLASLGTDPNPDTVLFHVQDILKKPLKDLRKSKRMPMFTPVRFQVDTLRDSVWAYTRDISLNGIFIRTIAPPPPETMVTVSFRAPTAEGKVQVGARVAWRKDFGSTTDPMKPAGMGIQFTRVSAPDGAAIEAGHHALGELLDNSDG
ncbi:MAG: PilZ domain-containing protein, partial [Deltaproteobacteria bacterium]|nr:PilZ domain-containing protein [Deltaproteobacteria bacterium]